VQVRPLSRPSDMNRPSAPEPVMFKFREELVGKRFLSVSGGTSRLKLNKISEWGWRAGVIRASSHRDVQNPELQVIFLNYQAHIFHFFSYSNSFATFKG
jgi:hypothetical protein